MGDDRLSAICHHRNGPAPRKAPVPSAGAEGFAVWSEGLKVTRQEAAPPMSRYAELDSVDIYLNTVCNLQCGTCFLGDDYFAVSTQLSVAEVESILRWAADMKIRDVAFLGGEPTLHPDLGELLALSHEVGVERNRLVTNGLGPFRRGLQSWATHLDRVYVSMDGPSPETHEAVRGKGTFGIVQQSIVEVVSLGIELVLTFTVSRQSVHAVAAMIEFAERSGCSELNIHWLSATGRASDGRLSASPDEWESVCQLVHDYVPSRSDLLVSCQVAYQVSGAPWTDDLDPRRCAVRQGTNLQFMPGGRVHACGLSVDDPSLAAYKWDGARLSRMDGHTELAICEERLDLGCPLRSRPTGHGEPDHGVTSTPVCIYERIVAHG